MMSIQIQPFYITFLPLSYYVAPLYIYDKWAWQKYEVRGRPPLYFDIQDTFYSTREWTLYKRYVARKGILRMALIFRQKLSGVHLR